MTLNLWNFLPQFCENLCVSWPTEKKSPSSMRCDDDFNSLYSHPAYNSLWVERREKKTTTPALHLFRRREKSPSSRFPRTFTNFSPFSITSRVVFSLVIVLLFWEIKASSEINVLLAPISLIHFCSVYGINIATRATLFYYYGCKEIVEFICELPLINNFN